MFLVEVEVILIFLPKKKKTFVQYSQCFSLDNSPYHLLFLSTAHKTGKFGVNHAIYKKKMHIWLPNSFWYNLKSLNR